MRASTFFTGQEREEITRTVREVEKATAGEVAVMVVDASDSYPESRILAGVLLGGLLALGLIDRFFADSLWLFVPVAAFLGLLIGWLAKYSDSLRRLFIPADRLEERVQERALRAFYEQGLYRTRDATGVLFFISLLEHKVWVLADRGIYEKIAPEELQSYAGDVARGVKSGQAAEALCREIRRVGVILARHFPIKPDDVNELTDRIITE